MNEKYKLSIVVPVYNLEKSIEVCVNSICNQSHSNLEVILVDDGSTDSSRRYIERLARRDRRIRTLFKENGGVTSARLAGCTIASGDYIGFVDGDDYIEPDMYEILLSNALKYEADISHCGYEVIYDNGKIRELYGTGKLLIQDNLNGIKDLLEGTFIEPGLCNKLFRGELIKQLLQEKLMDNKIKVNEDLLMNYYLFKNSRKSVFYDVCKYKYMAKANTPLTRNHISDPLVVKQIIVEDAKGKIKEYARISLLSSAVHTYCGLTLKRNCKFVSEREKLRRIAITNKDIIKLLPGKSRILAVMLCYVPASLSIMYPIYEKYFQKKRYE